ncbi:hypothetical protein [Kitasatospora sp. NPDC088351]|uniref:hypothetical protein n=1 Tax=Kitasatospora sp. NPDC088351 TaxID=3155180 RepID=UPI003447E12F
MNLTELLRADADGLERDFGNHDPVSFTRRLAELLTTGARPAAARTTGRTERPPAAARRQALPAARDGHLPRQRAESLAAGALTVGGRAELRRDLRHLCGGVAGAAEVGELALDLELADKAAFRTLGCLLYGMGRPADAVFWWRIAAQFGDPLAVHCLAVHYAAEGERGDAARWGAQAQDLSAPDRLPAVALGAGPDGAAELARALTEGFDGEIVLTLRASVATRPRPRPRGATASAGAVVGGASGGGGPGSPPAEAIAPRAVRGRGPSARIR